MFIEKQTGMIAVWWVDCESETAIDCIMVLVKAETEIGVVRAAMDAMVKTGSSRERVDSLKSLLPEGSTVGC
jgi:hypothetical protein